MICRNCKLETGTALDHPFVKPTAGSCEVARLEATRDAAQALLAKLDRIEASEEYAAVWYSAQIHRGAYSGETWEAEREALRATLAGKRGAKA